MPDIRYVSLSDTHFGAETSLLTNLQTASSDIDPTQPSPVLSRLVESIRYLISQNEDKSKKPTLVLNGDILELALATDNNASMTFERFIDLIMPENNEMFGRIIFNPGNHDHHIWETVRETQYVDFVLSKITWGKYLPAPWHATNMFSTPVFSYLLTNLIKRKPNLANFIIETAYPHFGVLSEDTRKCVIFHHGHFIESMYMLMSTLKNMLFPDRKIPTDIWDIENENFAWIDFFWSVLGRSGDVGKGIGRIYEKLQDQTQVKKLLANLANGIAKKYDLPGWEDRLEAKLLSMAFNAVINQIGGFERNIPEKALSKSAEAGLWAYMEGPLSEQILKETKGNMPAKVTFVFGHTHKPFQEDMNFYGYPEWTDVYNSGGWVVDTVERQPLHGGAVILVDENLDAISLRMYNEAEDPNNYAVTVEQAKHPGDQTSGFNNRVSTLVAKDPTIWKQFSDEVARAVNVRAQNLRAEINSERI